jgi:predicted Rdx family selenoprotein
MVRPRTEIEIMYFGKVQWLCRIAVFISASLLASLASFTVSAQIAPIVGEHYAARPTDTRFQGAVNSMGGYGTSVPLALLNARNGLLVPLQIEYGGTEVGAAGMGWGVPLSSISCSTSTAYRCPASQIS